MRKATYKHSLRIYKVLRLSSGKTEIA